MRLHGTKTLYGPSIGELDVKVAKAIADLSADGFTAISITPVCAEDTLFYVIVYGKEE